MSKRKITIKLNWDLAHDYNYGLPIMDINREDINS